MSGDKVKAADFLLSALRQEGVQFVFIVPGGLLDPLVSRFEDDAELTVVVGRARGRCGIHGGWLRPCKRRCR